MEGTIDGGHKLGWIDTDAKAQKQISHGPQISRASGDVIKITVEAEHYQ